MEDLHDCVVLVPTIVTIAGMALRTVTGLPSAVLRVMSGRTSTKFGIISFLIMSKPPHITVQVVYAISSVLTVTDLATSSCLSAGRPRSVYLSCDISKVTGPFFILDL